MVWYRLTVEDYETGRKVPLEILHHGHKILVQTSSDGNDEEGPAVAIEVFGNEVRGLVYHEGEDEPRYSEALELSESGRE